MAKKVVIFDFDLTLTDTHSGWVPRPGFEMMDGDAKKRLIGALNTLQGKGVRVYVCTRGVKTLVEDALKENLGEGIIGENGPIIEVYGADNIGHVRKGSGYWADLKTRMIERIIKKEKVEPEDVYFFDDTKLNRTKAKEKFPTLHAIHNKEKFSESDGGTLAKLHESKLLQKQQTARSSSNSDRQSKAQGVRATSTSKRSSSSNSDRQSSTSPKVRILSVTKTSGKRGGSRARPPTPTVGYVAAGSVIAAISAVGAILLFTLRR